MTFDPLEQKDGGVTRDRYGRRVLVAVDKHAAPSVTEVLGAGTVFDDQGREEVVLQSGPSGGNLLAGDNARETVRGPDSEATATAIERAWSRGVREVFYPPGVYDFKDGAISVVRDGMTFRSAGGAIITATADPPGNNIGFSIDDDIADGVTFDGLNFKGGVIEEGVYPRRVRNTTPSFDTAIYCKGDNAPDAPAGPTITGAIEIRNCKFANIFSLPVLLQGVKGQIRLFNDHFYNTLDVGFTFYEWLEIAFCSSRRSADNGFSLSRGGKFLNVLGLSIKEPAYAGLWLAGFTGDSGPEHFTVSNINVRTAGHYGLDFHEAPKYGRVSNVLVDGVQRGLTDGTEDEGLRNNVGMGMFFGGSPNLDANPTDWATELSVSNFTLRNCARGGVLMRATKGLRLRDGLVVNPGTQFLADGVTEVSTASQDTKFNHNFGLAVDRSFPATLDGVDIDDVRVIDDRGTPFAQYPLVFRDGCLNVRIGSNVSAKGTIQSIGPANSATFDGLRQDAGRTHIYEHLVGRRSRYRGVVASADIGAAAAQTVNDQAKVSIDPAGNNNAIVVTAVPTGSAGNGIALSLRNNGNSLPLAITVTGTQIVVQLATDAGGAITTTANALIAAIAADARASLLVTIANAAGNDGTGLMTTANASILRDGVTMYYRELVVLFPAPFANVPEVRVTGPAATLVVAAPLSPNVNGFTMRLSSSRAGPPAADIPWEASGT